MNFLTDSTIALREPMNTQLIDASPLLIVWETPHSTINQQSDRNYAIRTENLDTSGIARPIDMAEFGESYGGVEDTEKLQKFTEIYRG